MSNPKLSDLQANFVAVTAEKAAQHQLLNNTLRSAFALELAAHAETRSTFKIVENSLMERLCREQAEKAALRDSVDFLNKIRKVVTTSAEEALTNGHGMFTPTKENNSSSGTTPGVSFSR